MTCEFHTHLSSYNGKLRHKERNKTDYGKKSHQQSLQVRLNRAQIRCMKWCSHFSYL